MDPPQPAPQPANPPAPQKAYTLDDYVQMERNARQKHDWNAVRYFQSRQAELSPGTKENRISMGVEGEGEDPYSMENLFGAAVEPSLSMLSGAIAQPLAGLGGIGKAGYNVAARALGGKPEDAADFVRMIQNLQYQPHSQGGQTATAAMAAPFDWFNRNIAESGGRGVEEAMASRGIPGAALAGTAADTALQALGQVATGGVLGKAGKFRPMEPVAKAVGAVSPKLGAKLAPRPPDPDIDLLMKKGIVPTMGQRANVARGGGPLAAVKRFIGGHGEEWATRHPLLGANVIAARERAVQEHAWAQLNDARTPVGLKPLKPGDMTMHDAIKETQSKLSAEYDRLIGRLQGDAYMWKPGQGGAYPSSFTSELGTALTDAKAGRAPEWRALRTKEFKVLDDMVRDIHEWYSKPRMLRNGTMDEGGKIDGHALKAIQRMLDDEMSIAQRSNDPFYKRLIPYIERLQKAHKRMMELSNPGAVAEMRKIDQAWAQLNIVEDAATHGGAASKAGFFSPASTMRAVEKSARERLGSEGGTDMLARGEAQGQPLAEAAQRVLGNRVPNSGTPEALVAAAELSGDVATGVGDATSGSINKAAAVLLANLLGLPALYSRGVQSALAKGAQRPGAVATGALRMAPASLSAEERSKQYFDEQSAQDMRELGIP